MSVHDVRAAAVAETLAQVRAIEARDGVTREALGRLKELLTGLASRTELFPPEHFPVAPGGHGTAARRLFRLCEPATHPWRRRRPCVRGGPWQKHEHPSRQGHHRLH